MTRLEALPDWTTASTEGALRAAAEAEGASAGKLIHPVRLALTGVTVGAPLFDVMELLGRDASLQRLRAFLEATRRRGPPSKARAFEGAVPPTFGRRCLRPGLRLRSPPA